MVEYSKLHTHYIESSHKMNFQVYMYMVSNERCCIGEYPKTYSPTSKRQVRHKKHIRILVAWDYEVVVPHVGISKNGTCPHQKLMWDHKIKLQFYGHKEE